MPDEGTTEKYENYPPMQTLLGLRHAFRPYDGEDYMTS